MILEDLPESLGVLTLAAPHRALFPLKPGVVSGKDSMAVLKHAKDNGYAIPAVNCTCTSVINACLEAAKEADAPIMVRIMGASGGCSIAVRAWFPPVPAPVQCEL